MNKLQFQGKITEISEPRIGTTEKGEWASVEFEVTESQPQNPSYPQIGKFDLFKNGEYVKFAKEFKTNYPIGTEVVVEFNLKMNKYNREDGSEAKFYKTSAWKVNKASNDAPQQPFAPADNINEEEHEDLPF